MGKHRGIRQSATDIVFDLFHELSYLSKRNQIKVKNPGYLFYIVNLSEANLQGGSLMRNGIKE
jgi:hypothetical protein